MYQQEEEEEEHPQGFSPNERVNPDDVQFNLLAGNRAGIAFDPNAISVEERKMIEQALRDSEQQEIQAYKARQAQAKQTAQTKVNQASQQNKLHMSEQEQNMEMIARSEGLHLDENAKKQVKKVGKGGNN